jgi:hypothetical protein
MLNSNSLVCRHIFFFFGSTRVELRALSFLGRSPTTLSHTTSICFALVVFETESLFLARLAWTAILLSLLP